MKGAFHQSIRHDPERREVVLYCMLYSKIQHEEARQETETVGRFHWPCARSDQLHR